MKEDHERIWLQSADDAAAIGANREWCSAPVWPDDPGDSEPTEYVRSDLIATARTEARKAALEEAAAWHDRRAQDYRILLECTVGHPDIQNKAKASLEAHEKSATAIRSLIGTDPATDREEG